MNLQISPAYGDTFLMMLGVLALFLVLFVLYLQIAGSRRREGAGDLLLRPIEAYQAARAGLARAAETGRAMHTSPGSGGVGLGGVETASTLAGMNIVESMARVSAITGAPVQTTTNDAVAYNLAENALRQGYSRAGWSMDAESGGARFLTHNDPLAYAAGAAEVVTRQNVSHAVMAGKFGPEVLLLLEAQRRSGAQQIAGSSDPEGNALIFLVADQTLIGEEIFASGAYLEHRPTHIASVLAQDGLRWALIIVIVLGFIIANIIGTNPLQWFTMYP